MKRHILATLIVLMATQAWAQSAQTPPQKKKKPQQALLVEDTSNSAPAPQMVRSRPPQATNRDTTLTTNQPPLNPKANSRHMLIPTLGVTQSSMFLSNDNSNSYVSTSFDTRTMFGGGLLYEYGSGTFSGQTGLMYMADGSTMNTQNNIYYGGVRTSTITRVDYVGIPLLGKLNFPIFGKVKLTAKAGGIPLMPVASSSTTSYTQYGYEQTSTSNGVDQIRSFNVMGQVAVGVQVPISQIYEMRLEGSYNRMMMPIYKDGASPTTTSVNGYGYPQEAAPNAFSQSFGIMLGLGMKI